MMKNGRSRAAPSRSIQWTLRDGDAAAFEGGVEVELEVVVAFEQAGRWDRGGR